MVTRYMAGIKLYLIRDFGNIESFISHVTEFSSMVCTSIVLDVRVQQITRGARSVSVYYMCLQNRYGRRCSEYDKDVYVCDSLNRLLLRLSQSLGLCETGVFSTCPFFVF